MAARMQPLSKPITAVAAAVALFVAGLGVSQSARAIVPTLYVAYTMKCTFTITDDSGKTVTSIPPGNYQVQITSPQPFAAIDLSGVYDMTACRGVADFHLTGPGVDLESTLTDGDAAYDLLSATFRPSSTYTAVDNNQPTVARVTFTTTATGTPSTVPDTTTSASTSKTTTTTETTTGRPDPLRGTLLGGVSAAGKVTLTSKGRSVASLKYGRYTFRISDSSTTGGFLLQQIHKSASTLTSAAFKGTKSVTVDLKPGQWFFYPSAAGAKSYFIVIA